MEGNPEFRAQNGGFVRGLMWQGTERTCMRPVQICGACIVLKLYSTVELRLAATVGVRFLGLRV